MTTPPLPEDILKVNPPKEMSQEDKERIAQQVDDIWTQVHKLTQAFYALQIMSHQIQKQQENG